MQVTTGRQIRAKAKVLSMHSSIELWGSTGVVCTMTCGKRRRYSLAAWPVCGQGGKIILYL